MLRFSTLTALAAIVLFAAAPVSAQDDQAQEFTVEIAPLNDAGVSGTATLSLSGSELTVEINSNGLSAGLPHAQHIHIGGDNVCPGPELAGEDDLIDTAEGQPAYGEVRVSLTTEGDVSAESALAVERFPVSEDGSLSYSRTFTLPEGVAVEDVGNGAIVQHGVDLNGNGQYDGEAPSSLDPSLPLEATIPGGCGVVEPTAAAAGDGATTTTSADGEAEAGATTTTSAGGEAEAARQVDQTPQGGAATGAGGSLTGGGAQPWAAVATVFGLMAAGAGLFALRSRWGSLER